MKVFYRNSSEVIIIRKIEHCSTVIQSEGLLGVTEHTYSK